MKFFRVKHKNSIVAGNNENCCDQNETKTRIMGKCLEHFEFDNDINRKQ